MNIFNSLSDPLHTQSVAAVLSQFKTQTRLCRGFDWSDISENNKVVALILQRQTYFVIIYFLSIEKCVC